MPPQERQEPGLLDDEEWLALLASARIELAGRLPYSSNHTFLVRCRPETTESDEPGLERPAVYKPAVGERPLHDFRDHTLFRREAAAYLVDRALGWGLVPATVARSEGPLGKGSLQRFVDHDPEQHYFTLLQGREPEFRRLALFDMVCNNADRKSGHCLLGESGRIWAIDHGLTFHVEPKLRTVIWDFGGEPVPAADRDAVAGLVDQLEDAAGDLCDGLSKLLSPPEVAALKRRAAALSRPQAFPEPDSGWSFPWPLV